MQTKRFFYFAMCASLCIVASCNKNDDPEQKTPENAFTVTIADSYTSKTTISEEGAPAWSAGDVILINGIEYKLFKGAGLQTASFVPVGSEEAEPLVAPLYQAFSPASVYHLPYVDLPASINNISDYNPMYAYGDEKELQFHNMCGVIELTVKGTKTLSSIYLGCPHAGLAGRYQLKTTTPEPTLENPEPTPETKFEKSPDLRGPIVLNFPTGVALSGSGVTFRIPVNAKTPGYALTARFVASDGTVADYTFSNTTNPIPVDVNEKVALICSPEFSSAANDYLLPGTFSVSASKKVKFAEGNLYYDGINDKFAIEPFQYGNSPMELTGNSGNSFGDYADKTHLSYFFWAPDAARATAVNIYEENSVPAGDYSANDRFFAVNGGAIEGWTILTKDEMNYLLNTRTVNGGTGKGKTYKSLSEAAIDGIGGGKGLLIYPDNYTGSYNEDTWADIKAAGIVYLPAAGQCNLTKNGWVSNLKGTTRYVVDVPATSEVKTTFFQFNNGTVEWKEIPAKGTMAVCVRLVKEVK